MPNSAESARLVVDPIVARLRRHARPLEPPLLDESARRLGEEWRPWCCPEPRCVPVHTLSGSEQPLSQATPGESFLCFGAAPTVRFEYDGVEHVNDTRSCTYTPLKGVISYQENADDWRAITNAYGRAVTALLAYRDGDEGARNPASNNGGSDASS